jgi:hypothetical protein
LIILLHDGGNTVFKGFIQFIEISYYIVNNLITPGVDFLFVIPNSALSIFVFFDAEAIVDRLKLKALHPLPP